MDAFERLDVGDVLLVDVVGEIRGAAGAGGALDAVDDECGLEVAMFVVDDLLRKSDGLRAFCTSWLATLPGRVGPVEPAAVCGCKGFNESTGAAGTPDWGVVCEASGADSPLDCVLRSVMMADSFFANQRSRKGKRIEGGKREVENCEIEKAMKNGSRREWMRVEVIDGMDKKLERNRMIV